MGRFMSGYGVLSASTRSRVRALAERHRVRFIIDRDDSDERFRFESENGLATAAFKAALREDAALFIALQQEADLQDEIER